MVSGYCSEIEVLATQTENETGQGKRASLPVRRDCSDFLTSIDVQNTFGARATRQVGFYVPRGSSRRALLGAKVVNNSRC